MAEILVVDDEPDIRRVVELNLIADGHRVVTAADGDEALRVAACHPFDLIFLDLVMPGRDGFTVLEALKADETGLAEVPVIILTGSCERMDRIRSGIEGAVRYLTKPFSSAELKDAVSCVLAGGPEPVLRRLAQTSALVDLARVEAGDGPHRPQARPRLTRLEPHGPPPKRVVSDRLLDHSVLSPRQLEISRAVGASSSLTAAAATLGVSRTYLYMALEAIAKLADIPDGPSLARHLRGSHSALQG